jgi:hypothetical protein
MNHLFSSGAAEVFNFNFLPLTIFGKIVLLVFTGATLHWCSKEDSDVVAPSVTQIGDKSPNTSQRVG